MPGLTRHLLENSGPLNPPKGEFESPDLKGEES